ncbi:DUF5693 family protein [Bacillus sp. Marseille-P3661]|uniref:DUF5693 family protein n=1 Tax=Bacillus sp. Marseille-P3661 TaxID=1936234 RepID=UPI000C829A38|nr:DUF5693 family protein [Bacillus sp. Marseille-P3661]
MKKILLAIVALSILLTAPLIYNRAKVEWQNDTYEMIVPYDELQELTLRGLDPDVMYKELYESGVRGVAIEPTGIRDLVEDGQVITLTKSDMLSMVDHDEQLREQIIYTESKGLFILLKENLNPRWKDAILTTFADRIEEVEGLPTLESESLYFIQGADKIELLEGASTIVNPILTKPLGFAESIVEEFVAHGFEPVFRIGNDIDDNNSYVLDQMKKLSDQYDAHKILFTGTEMLGVPPHTAIEMKHDEEYYATRFKDEGYVIMPIEFTKQDGLSAYAAKFDNKIVRLHSLNFFDSRGGYTDRATRAVKERNIRALYLHVADVKKLESEYMTAEQTYEVAIKEIQAIQNQMADKHEPGIAQSYDILAAPIWQSIAALIGVAAFVALAAMMLNEKMALLTFGAMLVLVLGYVVTGATLFLQAAALAVSIVAATLAAISGEHIRSKKDMVVKFLKGAGLVLLGAWFVTALLYGNEFLVKIEEFRGVKLLFIMPIVLTALHVMRDHIKELAMMVTRNYYFIIIGILGAGFMILLARSGNDAGELVSGAELMFRQGLEDLMFVRPRTKEFLIGYPLFVLAMYIIYQGKGWEQRIGKYLLAGGAIGFMSSVNTFTHLHIPLYLSLLRTVYGWIIGAIIGLVLIALYRLAKKYWPLVQERL